MPAVAKRMQPWKTRLTPGKQYPIDDALKLVKEVATAKFAESVDVAVNLGIDASKSDQQVRGSTVLPHGIGKAVRVAVFTSGKNQDAARAGAALAALQRHLLAHFLDEEVELLGAGCGVGAEHDSVEAVGLHVEGHALVHDARVLLQHAARGGAGRGDAQD